MGTSYPYTIQTHCGIQWAYFAGRWWEAVNPTRGELTIGSQVDWGSMMMIDQGLSRFTVEGETVDFVSLPVDVQKYPGLGCD